MVKLINLILKLFKRKLVKVRCIDKMSIDSISPVYGKAIINEIQTKYCSINGMIEKEHFEWRLTKI